MAGRDVVVYQGPLGGLYRMTNGQRTALTKAQLYELKSGYP